MFSNDLDAITKKTLLRKFGFKKKKPVQSKIFQIKSKYDFKIKKEDIVHCLLK